MRHRFMSKLNNENSIEDDIANIHYTSVPQSINMNLLPILIPSTLLLASFTITEASLDLSNVDFSNYKFFKYPQKTQTGEIIYRRHQPFNIFDPIDHFNRAKAMLKYFTNVVLGRSQGEIAVFFHPDTAARLRPHFQQKFGYHGEKLIAALGSGHNKIDLIRYGALSNNDQ